MLCSSCEECPVASEPGFTGVERPPFRLNETTEWNDPRIAKARTIRLGIAMEDGNGWRGDGLRVVSSTA